MKSTLELLRPSLELLPAYADALRRGWSPHSLRPEAAAEQLAEIEADPAAFVRHQDDPDGRGPPIALSDGTTVSRTTELPPTCLGHVGYMVVPWKRGRGYATRALAMLLPDAASLGMPFVELTTDLANVASQRVIERNGGVLVERFTFPAVHGGLEGMRYRVFFGAAPHARPAGPE